MHAAVGRVVTTAWGQAYFDAAIVRCHERNQAWVVGDGGGLDSHAIDRDVDRLFTAAGLGHRRVLVEPPAVRRVAPALGDLGYDNATHLYLAHNGTAPDAPCAEVREVAVEDVSAANDHYLRTDPHTAYGRDDETRAHIVEHHRTYGRAGAQERCFAVLRDHEVIAWAKLWTRGREAQVEDVVCLAEHRGRGFGRDVVAAATRAALAQDPSLLFIVADADDWPQHLYRRLGFTQIGAASVHTRLVPGFDWGPPPEAG